MIFWFPVECCGPDFPEWDDYVLVPVDSPSMIYDECNILLSRTCS